MGCGPVRIIMVAWAQVESMWQSRDGKQLLKKVCVLSALLYDLLWNALRPCHGVK